MVKAGVRVWAGVRVRAEVRFKAVACDNQCLKNDQKKKSYLRLKLLLDRG